MSGWWWLARDPGRRVAGTLTESSDGGLRLETVGGLEDEPTSDAERIFGQCLGTLVTLVDARWSGARTVTSRSGEVDRDSSAEVWMATIGLLGKHTPDDEAFVGVRIESYWVDGWANIRYWESSLKDGVLLRFADGDDKNFQSRSFNGGTVAISVGMSQESGQRTWSVGRNTFVDVRRKSAVSLATCMKHVEHLDALTTILFGRPTSAKQAMVETQESRRLIGSGRRLIGIIAPPAFNEPDGRLHPPSDALCTFDQLGQLDGIAKWFSLSEDARYLAGRVASHHRAEGRFIEDRALTAFSVGEALDRVETRYAQSKARTRWKRLANAIPEFATGYLTMSVDTWADALVHRRDDLSHALSLGPRSLTARRQLEGLTTSAHLLSALTLFRLAGLGDQISAMTDNRRWRDLRDSFAYLTDGIA